MKVCRFCKCTSDSPCNTATGEWCWERPAAWNVCGALACSWELLHENKKLRKQAEQRERDRRLSGAKVYKSDLAARRKKTTKKVA